MPSTDFRSVADYALIGDCHAAALISSSGSIDWCCMPRFDSGSTFAALLDPDRGGTCTIEPLDGGDWQSTREYREDTLVLETTLSSAGGELRLIDCMLVDDRASTSPCRELLRVIEGVRGEPELELTLRPRFDYGTVRPWIRRHGDGIYSATGGADALIARFEGELSESEPHELSGSLTVRAGHRVRLLLSHCAPERVDEEVERQLHPDDLDEALARTERWWRRWMQRPRLNTEDQPRVRRSAMVLKALTYQPTGAVVAAPTTSLPEAIGGERNWDYRFAWIRDSSFSSRAFAEVGADAESDAFRRFIMRSAAGHADDLQIVYGIGGERRLSQLEVRSLDGYRGSSPVHSGNGAAGQHQHDAYGELVNLAWRWHRRGHSPTDDEWRFLVSLIDSAAERWSEPDSGIWEWPGEPDHFVHSKVLCWAALDRGLRLAEECMRKASVGRWRKARDELREEIERRGYDSKRGVFTQRYDHPELDAALLLLPVVEFVDWTDERMLRTTRAIRDELGAGEGLVYRYRRDDGLQGQEGAFLCCSFWLAECLARQGELGEAREVFELASGRANDLGLFSEELDPDTGEMLGNFPQALTHLAQIDAAVALKEAAGQRAGGAIEHRGSRGSD